MHLEIPHTISKAQAVARVKKGLLDARPQMQEHVTVTKEVWDGNTLTFAFTAQGKEITGALVVTDASYVVDAKLPLLWRMFEGKIEKMLAEQVKTLS